ncbi:MAG: hypothetical protein HPY66_2593 [Firmicutes bacterium]|nr:hypothetical protein [Bacillota bacterium]
MKKIVFLLLICVILTACSRPEAVETGQVIQETEQEIVADPLPKQLVMAAVGDIMLARVVGSRIRNNSVNYPFEKTSFITSRADISFGNLETTLATSGTRLPGKVIWFQAAPETSIGLKNAGFDVLSLANNHILDYDTPALMETIATLETLGIGYVGAGENLEQARRPIVVVKNDVRVGFLAYNEFYNYYWSNSYKRTFEATQDIAGTAPMKAELIEEDIKKLRNLCDILVVSLHWGIEESNKVTKEQQELAHRIIDWGADMILGHHPHVLQGMEFYKGKLIAYSLGNFVFDQNDENNKQSMILEIFLEDNNVKEVHAYPIYIMDKSQPQIPQNQQKKIITKKITDLCRTFGTEGRVEDDRIIFENR